MVVFLFLCFISYAPLCDVVYENLLNLIVISLCRYYSVSLSIGNPGKRFDLDIDTGSDLTWVQCDAPCTGCTKVNLLYK